MTGRIESFPEYVTRQVGSDKWVIAPRLSAFLVEKGYAHAIPIRRYKEFQAEWETQVFGAPLARLQMAAPALLRACQQVFESLDKYHDVDITVGNDGDPRYKESPYRGAGDDLATLREAISLVTGSRNAVDRRTTQKVPAQPQAHPESKTKCLICRRIHEGECQ